MTTDNESWARFVGQIVVIDTSSSFVYIGTLTEVLDNFLVMRDVDAHDRSEGQATKERYVMETKRFGVKSNRREVAVRKSVIVSVSKLDDVVVY